MRSTRPQRHSPNDSDGGEWRVRGNEEKEKKKKDRNRFRSKFCSFGSTQSLGTVSSSPRERCRAPEEDGSTLATKRERELLASSKASLPNSVSANEIRSRRFSSSVVYESCAWDAWSCSGFASFDS